MLKFSVLRIIASRGRHMKYAILFVALLFTTPSIAGCPQLPENTSQRTAIQRTYLAGINKRPNSLFAFADCAAEWADNVVNSDSLAPSAAQQTWRLVEDMANVLRRGAEKATNAENKNRYRRAWSTLGRSVITALKQGGFVNVDKIQRRKFIYDYGSNLRTMGAPHARTFIDDMDGLGQDLFGPEIVEQLVSAVDSCSVWDFVQGANRTDAEKQNSICLDDCKDYAVSVVGLLKSIPGVAVKPPIRRYERMLASCSTDSAGGAP